MEKILEMKQKRAALVTKARELIEVAEKEKRALDEEQYNKIEADIDKLGKDIEREERLLNLEGQMEQRTEVHKPEPQGEKRTGRAADEYRSAFWQALSQGQNSLDANQMRMLMDPEVRALAVGTDASGGYVVPDEFERMLIQKLEEQNIMRSLATVITTSSGSREIPVEASYGTATWLGEGTAYTESDASFNQKVLGAHKLGTIMKVSEELLQDSFFNMDSYVSDAFARRFGNAEETAFVNGDGTGKPTGIVGSAEVGKTGATGQTTSVTADDLIDVFHSLKRPYRARATWLLADATVKAIRKLKDSDGQYIWQPGLQAGQPDRILSRPLVVSDDVPAMAASAKSILFGDISYYWIADRRGRTMQRLNELYAANGQVGFRMYQRVDGKLILPEAVKYYANSAT
jgi:HK97 family phage major capsid protein